MRVALERGWPQVTQRGHLSAYVAAIAFVSVLACCPAAPARADEALRVGQTVERWTVVSEKVHDAYRRYYFQEKGGQLSRLLTKIDVAAVRNFEKLTLWKNQLRFGYGEYQ